MSGHTGARLLIEKLPASSTLIGDRLGRDNYNMSNSSCQFCIASGVAMPTFSGLHFRPTVHWRRFQPPHFCPGTIRRRSTLDIRQIQTSTRKENVEWTRFQRCLALCS